MAYEQQPAWVGGTIAFFAVTTAVAFGFFVHFYAMDSYLSEKRIHMILEHKELEAQANVLHNLRQPLEDIVVAKQERLKNIIVTSSDAKNDNKNFKNLLGVGTSIRTIV